MHFAERIQDHREVQPVGVVIPADRIAERGVNAVFVRPRQ